MALAVTCPQETDLSTRPSEPWAPLMLSAEMCSMTCPSTLTSTRPPTPPPPETYADQATQINTRFGPSVMLPPRRRRRLCTYARSTRISRRSVLRRRGKASGLWRCVAACTWVTHPHPPPFTAGRLPPDYGAAHVMLLLPRADYRAVTALVVQRHRPCHVADLSTPMALVAALQRSCP